MTPEYENILVQMVQGPYSKMKFWERVFQSYTIGIVCRKGWQDKPQEMSHLPGQLILFLHQSLSLYIYIDF